MGSPDRCRQFHGGANNNGNNGNNGQGVQMHWLSSALFFMATGQGDFDVNREMVRIDCMPDANDDGTSAKDQLIEAVIQRWQI